MRLVCALRDLAELEPRIVETEGGEVAVVRIGDEAFAFEPRCTHRPGPLAEGAVTRKGTILCPWHLATFDLRTGNVISGPAERPLAKHRVELRDGNVYVD